MTGETEARALSFEQYLEHAQMNVPTMKENFQAVEVKADDDTFFRSLSARLPKGSVRALALSEAWCGDCTENLPVLAKIAYLYPFLRLEIYPRDTNLDIMDKYLTDGKRTIPVFVFFDAEGVEIGRFIERPPGAHEFMNAARRKLENLSPEEQKKGMYQARSDLRRLYRQGLYDETISMIRRILEKRYEP